jgi:hypothetical protein
MADPIVATIEFRSRRPSKRLICSGSARARSKPCLVDYADETIIEHEVHAKRMRTSGPVPVSLSVFLERDRHKVEVD